MNRYAISVKRPGWPRYRLITTDGQPTGDRRTAHTFEVMQDAEECALRWKIAYPQSTVKVVNLK